MKTILIVGVAFVTLREYVINNDMEYVILLDKRKPSKNIDSKRVIPCDFSSKKSILAALKLVKEGFNINGVIATYENYVLPAAIISKELGLPGIPISAAEACTDKVLMRDLFNKCPVKISPNYMQINDISDLLYFADQNNFPLILKPANLAKSLLVIRCDNIQELKEGYRKLTHNIDKIYTKYAPNRKPKILVEEYIKGSIHSVDAFVDSDGSPQVLEQVVDYETGFDVGYDDNFHYSRILPSRLSFEQIESIRETARLGCKALGMKNTPAHIEIILSNHGPKIVEIGARNGGYRERMHKLADGIDILKNAIALATNDKLDLKAQKHSNCAVLEIFPKKSGIFKSISYESDLKNCKSLNYFALKQKIGTFVGKSSEGYKMCAIIILENSDQKIFYSDLKFIRENIKALTV